ncbi:histone deacetylase [bacterium BD-1]|nr:histone deacetylase [Ottowia caeni]
MRVVYSELMNAPAQGYSPSAAKPRAVMDAWLAQWPALQVCAPAPVTRDDLYRAHAREFVDGVLELREANGFGTRSPEVAASLPYTSGALLTAARWALELGGSVAAPVSGFHHAHWDEAAGFCTFNGLMVAALALRAERPALRIGILDYDYHYGDGTEDILGKLGREGIVHVTAGADWRRGSDAKAFLENIPNDLARLAGSDLVLYQAGADPHIDDPLGGFLTTPQLALRDWRVFAGLRDLGIPVAWDLAGGYQNPLSKVVTIHVNTMRAAIEAGN